MTIAVDLGRKATKQTKVRQFSVYFDGEVLDILNAGQLGLGSSRPEQSRPGSSRPGPILSLVGMCLIKNSLFNKS